MHINPIPLNILFLPLVRLSSQVIEKKYASILSPLDYKKT